MSYYKWTFLVNGWLSRYVSRDNRLIINGFKEKCKKFQLTINNKIIKPFKASNKASEAMSYYKWTFPVNGWLLLHVSQCKHQIMICFDLK